MNFDEIWDEWPPTRSRVVTESGARDDRPWSLAGRRARLTGSERGGLREAWVHPFCLLHDAQLLVNDREPEVRSIRIAPDEVVRVLRLGEAGMRVTRSHDPATARIIATATLTAHDTRFEVRGERLVRVILAGASSDAELERTLDALRRRKLRAFREERILHARRLEDRLTGFEAPDPARWREENCEAALEALRHEAADDVVVRGVIEGLWGVRPDAPASP